MAKMAHEYPCGAMVWHKANGKRGVVMQYSLDGEGCFMLEIDFGERAWEKCAVYCLSSSPVPKDDDDSWKETA